MRPAGVSETIISIPLTPELTSTSTLENTEGLDKLHERIDPGGLCAQLHNAVVVGDVQNLSTKLMREVGNGLEMLVLVSESL